MRVAERQVVACDLQSRRLAELAERSIVAAPVRAVDPLGLRCAVGAANGQRIGIDDEAVEPAELSRACRACGRGGGTSRAAANRVAGSRRSRRHVLGRVGPDLVAVDEQHDAIDEDLEQLAQPRVAGLGAIMPAGPDRRQTIRAAARARPGSLAMSSTNEPSVANVSVTWFARGRGPASAAADAGEHAAQTTSRRPEHAGRYAARTAAARHTRDEDAMAVCSMAVAAALSVRRAQVARRRSRSRRLDPVAVVGCLKEASA